MNTQLFGFKYKDQAFIINLENVELVTLLPIAATPGQYQIHIDANSIIELECTFAEGMPIVEGLAAASGTVFLHQ